MRALVCSLVIMVGDACHRAPQTIDLSCDQLQFDTPGSASAVRVRPGTVIDSMLAHRGQGRLVVSVEEPRDSGTAVQAAFIAIGRDSVRAHQVALQPMRGPFVLDEGPAFVLVRCMGCVHAEAAVTMVAGRTDTLEVQVARSHRVCDPPQAPGAGEKRRVSSEAPAT
jgi:hypothetical protein